MAKKFFTSESFNALITEFKKYADAAANKVKNDLLNGAGGAYDTLKELGDLIDDNHDAIDALETVAASKADKEHKHTVADIEGYVAGGQGGSGGSSVQSDWDQSDETAPDYIKNRPFYKGELIETTLLEEITLMMEDRGGMYFCEFPELFEIEENKQYTVTFNGTQYESVGWHCSDYGCYVIGNNELMGVAGAGNNEPFAICTYYSDPICTVVGTTEAGPNTIKISSMEPNNKTIDVEFLPKQLQIYETDPVETIFIEETTAIFDEDWYEAVIPGAVSFTAGKIYTVVFDGVTYNTEAWVDPEYGDVLLGDGGFLGISHGDTNVPFVIYTYEGSYWIMTHSSGNHTISVSAVLSTIKTLDEKYLPKSVFEQSDWDQNNPESVGYIKNKPFYSELVEDAYLFVGTIEVVANYPGVVYFYGDYESPTSIDYYLGDNYGYKLIVNDTTYELLPEVLGPGHYCFGGTYNADNDTYDFGEYDFAFRIFKRDANTVVHRFVSKYREVADFRVELYGRRYEHQKISDEYLVNPDWNSCVPSMASYIKNKPFGEHVATEEYESVIFDGDITLYSHDFDFYEGLTLSERLIPGVTYDVIINNNRYNNVVCHDQGETSTTCILGKDWSYESDMYLPFHISAQNWDHNADFTYYLDVPTSEYPETLYIKIYKRKCVLKKIDDKYLTQSDWNELDESKAAFINNKPFGEYRVKNLEPVVENFAANNDFNNYLTYNYELLVPGELYTIIFDGVEYTSVKCREYGEYRKLGSSSSDDYNNTNGEYPFHVSFHYQGNSYNTLHVYCHVPWQYNSKTISIYREVYETRINKIDPKYLPEQIGSGSSGSVSWNDLTDKPFYTADPVLTEIIPETTFTGNSKVIDSDISSLTIGETYTVVWDGTTYDNLVCKNVSGLAAIGASDFTFTDYPFLIGIDNGNCNLMASTNASHTVKVTGMVSEVVPLDRKYIAEYLDEIPVYAGRKVSGITGAEIFNNYSSNTASASYSHAEGTGTTASGTASHAEGYETVAEGGYSHAQGYKTQATGNRAHAEGQGSVASGNDSHAEGLDTIAAGANQHVQGKYNIEDTAGTYAHIVGNGSYNNRKNAHTLDWDGNAWYQGTVESAGIILGGATMTYDSENKRIVISVS